MKKIVLIILLFTLVSGVYCQKKVIYGKVDYVDYPVKNVIVTAKKSQSSVTTDSLGKYVIACEKNDVLSFETSNFYMVKKRVRYYDSIDVHLVLKPGVLHEEGVVTNNYMSSEEFEVALNEAKNKNNEYAKYTDIFKLIAIKFPGVEVTEEGVIIRGRSSASSIMTNAALYVVNGSVVRNISHISPDQIESIELLRGPAQGSAKYGSGSQNGVVVIKTK